jgi:hypothetical protein
MNDTLQIDEQAQEGFTVNDDNLAEWALTIISDATVEAQRLINVCQTKADEYQFKIQKYKEKLDKDTSYLKGQLQQYFLTVPHKSSKTQETYKLPSGTLKLKYQKPKFVFDDEKLLMYFRQHNYAGYIQHTFTPKWAEFKATIMVSGENVIDTVTGEVVDGVLAQERPAEFEVVL